MYLGDCNVYMILKSIGYDIDRRIAEINDKVWREDEEDKKRKKHNENHSTKT